MTYSVLLSSLVPVKFKADPAHLVASGHLTTMQRDIKRQHASIQKPLQCLLQGGHGPACIQLQGGWIGLVTKIAVATGKVATEGGHIQKVDMPGKLPDGRAIFSR